MMKKHFSTIGNAISLTCLITFMFSCSNPQQEIIPKSHMVSIRAMQFQPAELLVHQGDTIVFMNQDMLVHNITEEKTKAWSSQSLANGESYKIVISESVDYYCSLHPVMKGKILVE
jgi:plastocyanin